jgi:hypothetical protein
MKESKKKRYERKVKNKKKQRKEKILSIKRKEIKFVFEREDQKLNVNLAVHVLVKIIVHTP